MVSLASGLEVALAEDTPVRYGALRVLDLQDEVFGGVVIRHVLFDERGQPLDLVVAHHVAGDQGSHSRDGQDADEEDVTHARPGDEQHAHGQRDEHRGGSKVGLQQDQADRDADEHQAVDESRVTELSAGFLVAEIPGDQDQYGDLGEFRWLHEDRAEVEPGVGARARRAGADDQHREQRQDRRPCTARWRAP